MVDENFSSRGTVNFNLPSCFSKLLLLPDNERFMPRPRFRLLSPFVFTLFSPWHLEPAAAECQDCVVVAVAVGSMFDVASISAAEAGRNSAAVTMQSFSC